MPEKPVKPEHKTFDKCPHCGSERRDGEAEFLYRKAIGHTPKDEFPSNSLGIQAPMRDLNKPPSRLLVSDKGFFTLVMMTMMVDRCADCGTIYSRQVIVEEASAQVKTRGPG